MSYTKEYIMSHPEEFYEASRTDDSSFQPNSLLSIEIPANCSKAGIQVLAWQIATNAVDNGNCIKVAEGLAIMDKLVKAVRERPDYINATVDELRLHGGKITTPNGTTIEAVEAGVKYDYSYDDEWNGYDAEIKRLTGLKKAREADLRKAKPGKEAVMEETGELITGANKSSKSTYKVTLAK